MVFFSTGLWRLWMVSRALLYVTKMHTAVLVRVLLLLCINLHAAALSETDWCVAPQCAHPEPV